MGLEKFTTGIRSPDNGHGIHRSSTCMTSRKYTADPQKAYRLLLKWIEARAEEDGARRLKHAVHDVSEGAAEWRLFTAFSAVPRHLGKRDLELTDEELTEADTLRPGWNPSRWSIDQAGRTALVLAVPDQPAEKYLTTIEKIFSTADVGESVALYQSLPLLPHPESFRTRASEGVRSNVTSVFNAVALNNPYPAEFLDDTAWNQMVLKAIFVGSPLHRIQGLDRRANADLARMLVDFARERRAASRPVEPELWRPVGPFVNDEFLADLQKALQSDRIDEQRAAALALDNSASPHANRLLEDQPDLKRAIERGDLTWDTLSRNRLLSET